MLQRYPLWIEVWPTFTHVKGMWWLERLLWRRRQNKCKEHKYLKKILPCHTKDKHHYPLILKTKLNCWSFPKLAPPDKSVYKDINNEVEEAHMCIFIYNAPQESKYEYYLLHINCMSLVYPSWYSIVTI